MGGLWFKKVVDAISENVTVWNSKMRSMISIFARLYGQLMVIIRAENENINL